MPERQNNMKSFMRIAHGFRSGLSASYRHFLGSIRGNAHPSPFVGIPWWQRMRLTGIRIGNAIIGPLFWFVRRAPRNGWPAPRRILVLKTCCMGDVLFITPLLAALKHAYPDSHLTVATSAGCRPVIAHNPHVDAIIKVQARTPVKQAWRLARQFRALGFDLAVVPDRSLPLGAVVWLAGIARRAGMDSDGRGMFYTDRVRVAPDDYTRHEVALCAAVGAAVCAPLPPGQTTEYHPTTAALARADALIAAHGWQLPLWVIHPGGGVNAGTSLPAKRWFPERFATLADGLYNDHGGTVLLIGAPTDADAVRAVTGAMRHSATDLTGQLDFDTTLALARRAALYIGNDSGMTHVANAGGTPTVMIFGPTSPAQYGLWGGHGMMAVGHVPWSPCWRNGKFLCTCGTIRCMEAVTVEAVRTAAEETLRRTAEAGR